MSAGCWSLLGPGPGQPVHGLQGPEDINVRDALALARERGLDLIEVAPSAVPPVCRIMDYGKHKYDTAKKDRDSHKKQRGGDWEKRADETWNGFYWVHIFSLSFFVTGLIYANVRALARKCSSINYIPLDYHEASPIKSIR